MNGVYVSPSGRVTKCVSILRFTGEDALRLRPGTSPRPLPLPPVAIEVGAYEEAPEIETGTLVTEFDYGSDGGTPVTRLKVRGDACDFVPQGQLIPVYNAALLE